MCYPDAGESFNMATRMSMVSMLTMEATENMVDLYLTGAQHDASLVGPQCHHSRRPD